MTDTVTAEPVEPPSARSVLGQAPRRAVTILPSWWPLALLTLGFPVFWVLGIAAAAWPLVSLLLVPGLLRNEHLRVPRGFGLWALFILWVTVSATQLGAVDRVFSFGYRYSVYFAATVLFLYVYNQPEDRLPTTRVISLLVGLWSAVAFLGLVGAVAPRLEFPSVAELLLPKRAFSNPLVYSLAHPRFAQVSRLFGQEIGRPHALFPYTNGWGSTFGILFTVTVAWLAGRWSSKMSRLIVVTLIGLSLFSVIASLNRGLWLSLALGLVYTSARFAGQRRPAPLFLAGIPIVLVAVILSVTPLGTLFTERAEEGHSDEGRSSLYVQSIELGMERPILGWGSPQQRTDKDEGPNVGTHGHMWLILVSQGFVGIVLYLSWWTSVILRTWRQRTTTGIWLHATMLVVVMQAFVYEHTPIQLPIAMIVAALLLRAARRDVVAPPELSGVRY